MCGICGCSEETGHEHEHEHEEKSGHGHGHGHGQTENAETRTVTIERAVMAKNDRFASFNRGWFAGRDVFAVNVLSSPGSGKTSLLERMIRDRPEMGLSVIEGDLATDRDAERIRAAGARVTQINTGAVCHLDAHMVGHALEELAPERGSVLFIENVGNLVCPAMFDLGEHARLVLFSVTEGEDKPIKYPHMFVKASAIVITKADLLPHVPFDLEAAMRFIRRVNPKAPIFTVSALSGHEMVSLYDWLDQRRPRARGAER